MKWFWKWLTILLMYESFSVNRLHDSGEIIFFATSVERSSQSGKSVVLQVKETMNQKIDDQNEMIIVLGAKYLEEVRVIGNLD